MMGTSLIEILPYKNSEAKSGKLYEKPRVFPSSTVVSVPIFCSLGPVIVRYFHQFAINTQDMLKSSIIKTYVFFLTLYPHNHTSISWITCAPAGISCFLQSFHTLGERFLPIQVLSIV